MPHRYIARRAKRFFLYRVLHVDDTPHRIALGVAIGMWAAWMPIVGIQMIVTVILAFALRANKIVGLPWLWISNPATMAPIYIGEYYLGRALLGGDWPEPRFIEALHADDGGWAKLTAWLQATGEVAWPLFLGGFVLGVLFGVPTYFIIRWAVVAYRRHRHRKQALKALPEA